MWPAEYGALTWANDQMAEWPNRVAEQPNRPYKNCPLFAVKVTTLKYYQIYGGYRLGFDLL